MIVISIGLLRPFRLMVSLTAVFFWAAQSFYGLIESHVSNRLVVDFCDDVVGRNACLCRWRILDRRNHL
jgi:hypothetical protein